MAQRAGVDYQKTVERVGGADVPGEPARSGVSAAELTYGAGFLAGYRLALRPTGIYLSAEGDMIHHSGSVRGALGGAGKSVGFNQVGDAWPEDWEFQPTRSFGATVRVGSGIPILGSGSGASVYLLLGLRRREAEFRTESTGCLSVEPCTEPDQFSTSSEEHADSFTGWVTGAGLEKRVGSLALRGEVRYAGEGGFDRVTRFDDLQVRVPTSLKTDGITLRADLLWYF